MARTFDCSTWESVRQAATANYTQRTINITNDIDLNNESPYGVDSANINGQGASDYYDLLIIDGHGYEIRNLRTRIDNPVPIFNMPNGIRGVYFSYILFRNIDFVNCILAGSDFIRNTGVDIPIRFENCRFVGCRTGNAYLINQDIKITCTSCYFDMPWYGSGSSVYDYTSLVKRGEPTTDIPTANYCWFHESYCGWTITNSSSSADVKPDVPTTSCCMFAMNGCYIDGQVKLGLKYFQNGPSYYTTAYCYVYRGDIGSYYTASTPNVIDVDWISDFSGMSYSQNLTCYVLNMNAVFKKSMTTTNYSSIGWSRSSAGSQPNIILATPEQMQNPTWLQSQGFPIIVPTT